MRKAGQQPSKEFIDERKRLQKEKIAQQHADYEMRRNRGLGLEQDRYLENIAELNKFNAQHGLPKIRTEVRYTKATPEIGVDHLQASQSCLGNTSEPKSRPRKKKKVAKKKTTQKEDSN